MKKVLFGVFAIVIALAWIASDVRGPEAALRAATGAPADVAPDVLMIPVAGVERRELRDSFYDGRVGHVHEALDIMARRGTPVLAAVDGTIQKLFTSQRGGLTIYEFDATSTRSYYYAHLDHYAAIREGQKVRRGDVIGYVGSSGNAQTPHLHFGIAVLPAEKQWWKGVAVDPYPELMARGVTKPVAAPPEHLSESR